MWMPLLGLLIGVVLGILLPLEIPAVYSHYFAVLLLGVLEGVFTGLEQGLKKTFDLFSFWSGMLVTIGVAVLLVYIGEHLGIELYLAVLFAFGYRILNSVSSIHALTVEKFKSRLLEKRE